MKRYLCTLQVIVVIRNATLQLEKHLLIKLHQPKELKTQMFARHCLLKQQPNQHVNYKHISLGDVLIIPLGIKPSTYKCYVAMLAYYPPKFFEMLQEDAIKRENPLMTRANCYVTLDKWKHLPIPSKMRFFSWLIEDGEANKRPRAWRQDGVVL